MIEQIITLLPKAINLFVAIPTIGFFLSLLVSKKNERWMSRVAIYTAGLNLFLATAFIIVWAIYGFPVLNMEDFHLYESKGYVFLVDLYFDHVTAVYLFVGSYLTFLILVYSRSYLHLEAGYKRFFNTVLFFMAGYNLTIFSGNFETLFIGWEILGMSSFLLVAFYRERYLPVKNAVRVFSIYRIGDVGVLLAMWASHHFWHQNIGFLKFNEAGFMAGHLEGHQSVIIFISLMILLAAAAKSAQFPFSSWLPRAMEGPTSSSAIFYGSLSVHFGVFLLLRTFPFWESIVVVRVLVGLLGLVTALIAWPIARIQSSIKTKLAYASIVQIGIIFIEIAVGFEYLALFHFAGNAFLRTYQLLVSPSVVSYKIREQHYHFNPNPQVIQDGLFKRLEYTIYQRSLREFNLDVVMNRLVFRPIKNIGHSLAFIKKRNVFFFFIPLYVLGVVLLLNQSKGDPLVYQYLPGMFSLIGLLMVFRAFGERTSPRLAWLLLIMNHFWAALAISFNDTLHPVQLIVYLSGVIVMGIVGYLALTELKKRERRYFSLNRYYGHVYAYPKLAFIFLLSCLGLMGFPITPTFIGEDLIFSHIQDDEFFLALFNAVAYIVSGIAVVRIYARLYLGPYCKMDHPTALPSA